MQVQSLGREDPLDKGTTTYSSILAWRIPWIEETGGLQPMESRRVRHNRPTTLVVFHFLSTLVLLHMQGSAELNHWESDCDRKEK